MDKKDNLLKGNSATQFSSKNQPEPESKSKGKKKNMSYLLQIQNSDVTPNITPSTSATDTSASQWLLF